MQVKVSCSKNKIEFYMTIFLLLELYWLFWYYIFKTYLNKWITSNHLVNFFVLYVLHLLQKHDFWIENSGLGNVLLWM